MQTNMSLAVACKSFGGVRSVDRVRQTVPGGRTSNGNSLGAAVHVESVSWYVQ